MPTLTDLVGPAGPLEALLDEPDSEPLRAAVVFAHPHPQFGGTLHTKVVYQGAKALSRIGCAVLRFNFRGVGRSAGSVQRWPWRDGRLPGGARLHGGTLLGVHGYGPRGSRSGRGWRSSPAPGTIE